MAHKSAVHWFSIDGNGEETIRDGKEPHGKNEHQKRRPNVKNEDREIAVSSNNDPGRRLFCSRHLVRGRLI